MARRSDADDLRVGRRPATPELDPIRHVGRKSGHTYETPVILASVPEGFIADLTYGACVPHHHLGQQRVRRATALKLGPLLRAQVDHEPTPPAHASSTRHAVAGPFNDCRPNLRTAPLRQRLSDTGRSERTDPRHWELAAPLFLRSPLPPLAQTVWVPRAGLRRRCPRASSRAIVSSVAGKIAAIPPTGAPSTRSLSPRRQHTPRQPRETATGLVLSHHQKVQRRDRLGGLNCYAA